MQIKLDARGVLLILGLLTVLGGCSASGPRYANAQSNDAAVIGGNFVSIFKSGGAHVHILEIDGVATKGGVASKTYRLTPGKHQLGIHAISSNNQARKYIEIDFPPHARYKITGDAVGISMVLKLWNVTNEEPKLIKTYKINSSATPTPIYIPIPIY